MPVPSTPGEGQAQWSLDGATWGSEGLKQEALATASIANAQRVWTIFKQTGPLLQIPLTLSDGLSLVSSCNVRFATSLQKTLT